MLTELVRYGLSCTYAHLHSLSYVMKEVSKVFCGAYALLSNGR